MAATLLCAVGELCAQGVQEPLATADAKAAEIFQQTGSTAMVLVVVRGREVHMRGFGETAPGSGQLPQPGSLLRLCSLTKVFAADLLIKLAGDKTVRLDDPLERFAPAKTKVPMLTLHGARGRAMTLGDLATHTAGLPREVGPAPVGTAHFTFPDYAQRWAWLPRQRLKAAPGTVALYSNVGFDLLGDALSSAAHKPYEALLRERTTGPLGLRDTTFSPTAAQCARLLVGFHAPRANEPPVCTDTVASAGSSGLYSTANDMARWLEYLLGTSEIKQNPVAQAVYLSPANLVSVKGLDHAGEPAGIGLGWMVLDQPQTATRIVEKTGGGAGFSTYIALDQARHTGVFVALTEGGPWQENAFRETNNLLLGLGGLPPMEEPPVRARRARGKASSARRVVRRRSAPR